jgi:hypothetical protein
MGFWKDVKELFFPFTREKKLKHPTEWEKLLERERVKQQERERDC